ncbi:hypothetical protein EDD22DRAFT_909429 [Suillus occidentalis]|nr:hypothetical protein EDD22DRAFT_909429 [Suillus occidentalis]
MAVSQTTHRIQGTRWTLHTVFGVDAAQGVCRDCCTPDVTLSSIHYIRKLTLHHIMAYDHQPHPPHYYITHSLTHANQTTPNQLLQQPKSTRLRGLLSAYMHPADLLCMLSAHAKLTFASICPLFFYFIFHLFVFVHSLFRRVSSSSNSMLLVELSVCFSRFVVFSYTMGMSSFPLFRFVLGVYDASIETV